MQIKDYMWAPYLHDDGLSHYFLPVSTGLAESAGAGCRGPASLWERRYPSAQSSPCVWTGRPAYLRTHTTQRSTTTTQRRSTTITQRRSTTTTLCATQKKRNNDGTIVIEKKHFKLVVWYLKHSQWKGGQWKAYSHCSAVPAHSFISASLIRRKLNSLVPASADLLYWNWLSLRPDYRKAYRCSF